MLIVTYAKNQRGWSNTDHMLDDEPLERLVGKKYRTWAELKRVANAAADNSYAIITYQDTTTGETVTRGTEPRLPGREPLYRLGE